MSTFEPQNPAFAEYVRKVVTSMPAARWVGFQFLKIEPGTVEIALEYRVELTQHDGFFQGAVIGALADFAGASAAGTLLPANWALMTADYTLKLIAPANGSRIIARGLVIRPSAQTTVAKADVFAELDGRETMCATALVSTRNFALPGSRR